MCKVLMIPKITKKTRTAALAFMQAMKPLMSVSNRDGLGYAATDSTGALFGERWHTNEDSYNSLRATNEDLCTALDDISEKSYAKATGGSYNSFGKVNLQDITALTMHTRFATSGKEFKNTHPFHYEDMDTSLIHNGVIDNVKDFKFKVSTCDSESILISYLDANVGASIDNIQAMAERLKGYYACGVLSRDTTGARVMDIFKGPTASLYGTFITELESYVFCTSMDDMIQACKSLGFTLSNIKSLKEGVAMRFKGGELIEKRTFTPAARWSWDYTSPAKTTAPKNVTPYKPKTSPILPDMAEYLHTIPNIQQVMS